MQTHYKEPIPYQGRHFEALIPGDVDYKKLDADHTFYINTDLPLTKGAEYDVLAELKLGGETQTELLILDLRRGEGYGAYRAPFGEDSALFDKTADFLLIDKNFDPRREGSSVGFKAIRKGETIPLGRNHLRSRFEYSDNVSRNHAEIACDKNGQLSVRDIGSTNGSFLRAREIGAFSSFKTTLETRHDTKRPHMEAQAELTKEVLMIPGLSPKYEVKAGDKTFYISDVLKSHREVAVLYSTIERDGHKISVPRLLYKSHSDGGWRVAYGVAKSGRLIKEAHRDGHAHYTQETKLHNNILDQLETADKVEDSQKYSWDKLKKLFSDLNQGHIDINTAPEEISYVKNERIDRLMRPFRTVSAGYLTEEMLHTIHTAGHESFGDYIDKLNRTFDTMPGFIPNFNYRPMRVSRREHSLLGPTKIEEYPAIIGGKRVIWSMAQDSAGRTWVDNIRLENTKISSYGNYSEVFDAGIITSKPLEYHKYAAGLVDKEQLPFDSQYADITPVLGNILPIRQYKKAQQTRNGLGRFAARLTHKPTYQPRRKISG